MAGGSLKYNINQDMRWQDSLDNFVGEYIGYVIALAIIIFIFHNTKKWQANAVKMRNDFRAIISSINEKYKTNFPLDEAEERSYKLMLGKTYSDNKLYFDVDAKKVLRVANNKASIHDYSYLRGWQLQWTDVSKNGSVRQSNVHFHFKTDNIDEPTFDVQVDTYKSGLEWNSRLDLLDLLGEY